jgi:hypothetical protein
MCGGLRGARQMSDKLPCFYHPNRETRVSCGRCDRPLCPDCVRHGATGVRCKECISLSPEQRGLANRQQIRNALAAALGVAVAGGVLFGLLNWVNVVTGAALGFGIGLAAFHASGRHRDVSIQALAGGSALVGLVVAAVISSSGGAGPGAHFARTLVNISFFQYVLPAVAAIFGAMVRFLL